MSKEQGWSLEGRGVILSAFAYSYAPMQLPSGWCAHRFGGRSQIAIGLAIVALSIAATPGVVSLLAESGDGPAPASPRVCSGTCMVMCGARLVQGLGSSLLNPALHKLISSWAPYPSDRTWMHNVVYSGQSGGSVLGLVAAALLLARTSWRTLMYAEAGAYGVWLLVWLFVVYDSPEEAEQAAASAVGAPLRLLRRACSMTAGCAGGGGDAGNSSRDLAARTPLPRVADYGKGKGPEEAHAPFLVSSGRGSHAPTYALSEEAKSHAGPIPICSLPWRKILRNGPFLALTLNHFCFDWLDYTMSAWVPTWLDKHLHYKLQRSGLLAALSPLAMCVVVVVTGAVVSRVVGRGLITVTAARKLCQGFGLLVPAALLCTVGYVVEPTVAVACLVGARAVAGLCLSGHHINHIDLGHELAPILYGFTNTIANVAGALAPAYGGIVLGAAAKGDSDAGDAAWRLIFMTSGSFAFIAGCVWLRFASGQRQF